MKSLRIAVQMDPIEKMIVNHDTSLALMVEAQARGHELWWWAPNDLFYDTGVVKALARRVSVNFGGILPGVKFQSTNASNNSCARVADCAFPVAFA